MSEFDLLVQAYMDMGVPRKEAEKQARFDLKEKVGEHIYWGQI